MADTTILFAPQVAAIQPAFIKNDLEVGDGVKIPYSLSAYSNITPTKVKYRAIDPNQSTAWGSNFMTQSGEEVVFNFNRKTEIYLKSSDLKDLTTNQFYQVQIAYQFDGVWSPWSQPTLIRQIGAHTASLNLSSPVLSLDRIEGKIQYGYAQDSIEGIVSFSVYVKDGDDIVYQKLNIPNTLGTEFATNIYDCYLNGDYDVVVKYTTVHGYIREITQEIHIGLEEDISSVAAEAFEVEQESESGSVEVTFKLPDTFSQSVDVSIQRTSDKSGFVEWKEVQKLEGTASTTTYVYRDLSVDTETFYKYRIVVTDGGRQHLVESYKLKDKDNNVIKDDEGNVITKPFEDILVQLEDIYLLGEDKQLAVKYNPNISGFKWVTQESITNTLGGRFPIIRVNGQTKYRQFSLSGTLSFRADWTSLGGAGVDSRDRSMSHWFKEDNCSLLFDAVAFMRELPEGMRERMKTSASYVEKKYREIAMAFLTDQKPKLFRSATEDTMIVYLSGVSFTPNKTLGREVWDFSCTVTELCEVTEENLVRFGLKKAIKTSAVQVYGLSLRKGTFGEGEEARIYEYVSFADTLNGIPILYPFLVSQ